MGRVGPRPPDAVATEHETIVEMRKRLDAHKREYVRQCNLIDRQLFALLSTSPEHERAVRSVRAQYDVSPYGWSDAELASPAPAAITTTWRTVSGLNAELDQVGGTD